MHYKTNNSKEFCNNKKDFLFQATSFNEAILVKGEGNYVYDMDGNKYLDLNSGQFCLSFGHCNEEFAEVVFAQLKKIYHTNTSYNE